MREVIKLYRVFNGLSLDVAAGAVICSLLFAKCFEVVPSIPSLISLGLTVWIIYTADRLLDIREVVGEAASERHRFHQRNQKKLVVWLFMIMVIDLVLIFFMPAATIKSGTMLSIVVAIYLLFRKLLHISKELLVATLYTAGVLLPVWPSNAIGADDFLLILLLFFTALLNLIVFSSFERIRDMKENQPSVATVMDEKSIRYILTGLFIIAFSICFHLVFQPAHYFIVVIFFSMISILLLIILFKGFFLRNEYYRMAGDAVFLLPLIYLLT